MKPSIKAYLTKTVKFKSPYSGKVITLFPETFILVNVDTGLAWARQYELELTRDQFALIH